MKRTFLFPLFLAACPLLLPAAARSETAATEASAGAAAAWAELEPYLKPPTEKPADPKDRKALLEIYKRHIEAGDAKAAAFLKKYPDDPHRWNLLLQDSRTQGVREATGLPAKGEKALRQGLLDIMAAPDADAETKGTASFMNAVSRRDAPEEFRKLAAVHLEEYPDFAGNAALARELSDLEAAEKLKADLAAGPLDLKFTATDGTEVDLAKMRGKVVLIDFWATWCGPCVIEIPNVVAAYNKLHPEGFEILGISFDQEKEPLDKMTKEKNMPWPQYFDGKGWKNEIGQRFGINSIPAMWLVNKKGMVVDLNGRADLEKKVADLLAENG